MKKIFWFSFILFILLFSVFTYAQKEDNQIIDWLKKQDLQELENINLDFKKFNSCNWIEKTLTNYFKNMKDLYIEPEYYPIVYENNGLLKDEVYTTAVDAPQRKEWTTTSNKNMDNWGTDIKSSSNDYSKTNLQKENIDEPEILKTNWDYIIYFNRKTRKIYIIKSPLDITTSKINLKNVNITKIINVPQVFYNTKLFLSQNKLVVVADRYKRLRKYNQSLINKENRTTLVIYDISDINNLKLEKLIDLDWNYKEMRMIWNDLYIVSKFFINRWYVKRIIDWKVKLKENDILPKPLELDLINKTIWAKYADCKNVYYILPTEKTLKDIWFQDTITAVYKINITDHSQSVATSTILANTNNIHMTKKSLYLVQNLYLNNNYRIRCEFWNRCVIPYYDWWNYTLTHKLKLNEDWNLSYLASNIFPWNMLNQYSMDEDKDWNFRILTHKWNKWTNLYIMDNWLKILWSLENIEPKENFKSSRYIWNKLYLVTFKQIDPLFVIDMSDLKNPKIVWELKMPWYSTYLHPLSEEKNWIQYLIWLWYNVTKHPKYNSLINSWIKIDLYKIDFNKKVDWKIEIKQLYSKVLWWQWSYSEVLNNPRMFVMDKNKNITIPVSLYERYKDWENCNLRKDYNWKIISQHCYPIYKNKTLFVWLKRFSISEKNWIVENFSFDYKEELEKYFYNWKISNTWSLRWLNFRVWYMWDVLYYINNNFVNFVLPTDNSNKYLYFVKKYITKKVWEITE